MNQYVYWSYMNTGEGLLSWAWVTRAPTSRKSPAWSNRHQSCLDEWRPLHKGQAAATPLSLLLAPAAVRCLHKLRDGLWSLVSWFVSFLRPADFFPFLHKERLRSGGKSYAAAATEVHWAACATFQGKQEERWGSMPQMLYRWSTGLSG